MTVNVFLVLLHPQAKLSVEILGTADKKIVSLNILTNSLHKLTKILKLLSMNLSTVQKNPPSSFIEQHLNVSSDLMK